MLERINEIFYDFQSFPPNHPIVRSNTVNDAYSIYVFEKLFFPYHRIKKFTRSEDEHRQLLFKSIVPPPDDSIDIFFEVDELDEKSYHIVQVKNTVLRPADIELELNKMEKTISNYLKNAKDIRRNLKEIIAETDFSKQYKSKCHYYLVHEGNTKTIRYQKPNHTILNFSELQRIGNGIKSESVPFAEITGDTRNNFIINNLIDDNTISSNNSLTKPKSLLCNFNGYDLAKLNNEYADTLAGRNILYGQNLRESLSKKSKTYESMFETIDNEPDLFLFYNNGVTVLCSHFNTYSDNTNEKITLKNFSIINGAQTTSTLGEYLKEALIEENLEKIEKLKKVFVLTKIYEINSSLKHHEKIGNNIRIFTNTQTPLSTRDMVSIRPEQIELQKKFLNDFKYPNIFVTIKNGEMPPATPALFKYQIISNERLAQLCFAGPLSDPFTAKDKRSKLFNVEFEDGKTLNTLYHNIFDRKDGLLFRMSNIEVDELLFVYKLHEDTKKFHQADLKKQIKKLTQDPTINESDKNSRSGRIDLTKRYQEIAAVFIFHNISAFYLLKRNFDSGIMNSNSLVFNSRLYYNDLDFKANVIELFYKLIYRRSIKLIAENSGIENIQNWTRSSNGSEIFINKVNEMITLDSFEIEREYHVFISKAKTTLR